ncbi:MAG: tyrosine-type recombinase/integrase, partial [Thermincolia bacterium]
MGMNQSKRRVKTVANNLDVAIDRFLFRCRNKNLRPSTIEFYSIRLNQFFDYMETNRLTTNTRLITKEMIEHYIAYRHSKNEAGTVATSLRALKAFFAYLSREGIAPENPAKEIEKIKVDKKPIIPFSEKQMKLLMDQPDTNTFTGYRDYIILKLLWGTGMRLSEALSIQTKEINMEQGRILLTETKNRFPRVVGIPRKLQPEMRAFITLWMKDALPEDYLFQNQDCGQLKKRTFQENVKKYGEKAGITGVRCSPHTLRHTYAINYLKNGGSTASLRQ